MATETVTTVTQPPEFIESEAKLYLDQLRDAIGGLKGADLSTILGPQFIAGLDPLQKQAMELAGGLGSYKPYLEAAEGFSGPEAYKQFMSPYQSQVIDASLAEFDRNKAIQEKSIADQAIASGAFGGGREGVQRAEYQSTSDRNRAGIQANLLQQGFTQANQLANQAFGQQMNLATKSPALAGAQIAGLTTLGGMNQAQNQAKLSAQQQLLSQQLYQPLTTAQQYGSGIMGLISGYPGQTVTQTAPSPSPFQTGISAGATLAGLYRAF